MPGRKFESGSGYRFGFNGKENDKDISEGDQDYGLRIYDARLARFLSVDPNGSGYPYYSSYQFAGNTPIQANDLDGGEPAGYSTEASFKHPGNEWLRTASDVSVKSNVSGNWYKMLIHDAVGKDWIVYRQTKLELATYNEHYVRLVQKVDFYYLDNNCNAPAPGQNWITNSDGSFAGNLVPFDAQERIDAKAGSAFADAVGITAFALAGGICAIEAGVGVTLLYRGYRAIDKLNEKEAPQSSDKNLGETTSSDEYTSTDKNEEATTTKEKYSKREARDLAKKKREEQAASENYAKHKAKELEKLKGKDARRKAHDAKEKGAGDRTRKQLDKDYQ